MPNQVLSWGCWGQSRALDYYKPKIEEEIRKLTKKVNGEKNPTKKEKLQEDLSDSKDIYNAFYNGGY